MIILNKILIAAIVFIVAVVVAIVFIFPASIGTTDTQPAPVVSVSASPQGDSGATQTFTLGYKNGRYNPPEIRVKLGTNVRIEGDPNTLRGCMLVVNIEGYGISKPIRAGDNVIEFTADKAGTFPIYCNMGIGDGRLVVE
ncbi:MAG: cupredoxin domain-containing protein [Methanoregula sp.]